MSIRFTEEEAKRLGFKQDSKGDWHNESSIKKAECRVAKNISVRDSGKVPTAQQRHGNDGSREGKAKKSSKKTRLLSLGGENDVGKRYRIRVTSYRVADADPDNIVTKWYIDELVKAKIIPGDSSKYVDCVSKWVSPVATPEEERTLVEVFEYDH
jgi:hypothetical protein